MPPNARPISGREVRVSSFSKYMAIWRGNARLLELIGLQAELLCDGANHRFCGDAAFRVGGDVLESLVRHGQVDARSGYRRIRDQLDQRALQLANVRFGAGGDEHAHVVG